MTDTPPSPRHSTCVSRLLDRPAAHPRRREPWQIIASDGTEAAGAGSDADAATHGKAWQRPSAGRAAAAAATIANHGSVRAWRIPRMVGPLARGDVLAG